MQVGKAALLMTSRDPAAITATQEVFATAPGASRKALARMAKQEVQQRKRLTHAASLQVQGKFLQLSSNAAARTWSRAIQSTSSDHLKFAINAALPHNTNLALWRKESGLSDKCKLCGERRTLAHPQLLPGRPQLSPLQ